MKKTLLILSVLAVVANGCNQAPRKQVYEQYYSATVPKTEQTETSSEQEPPKKERDFSTFPEDFLVKIMHPTDDYYYYYFYPDNFLVRNSRDGTEIGEWTVRNDSIFMVFTKYIDSKGYGELIPGDGRANIADIWEFYYNYEIGIERKSYFTISEIMECWDCEIDSFRFASDFKKDDIIPQLSGKYTFASIRELDSLELTKYTRQELRIMRNEIFARYGFIFESKDLREHFAPERWYLPIRKNVDKFITDLEKKNIELIKKQESAN